MSERLVTVAGHVQFLYPRGWWQLWKRGWFRHENMGGRCWIRFAWPEYIDHAAVQQSAGPNEVTKSAVRNDP